MRIGMIGLGDIACKAYLPVVAANAAVTPLLCTRNTERLSALARQYRIADTFVTLDELIAARPDAVMIHSATSTHATYARQLLEQGIAVFIDKPLSYHLHECEALLELAAAKQVPLTLGFNRRYAPLIQPLGKCKSLVQARLQKNRTNLPAEPRHFIYDDFIHVLDTLRYITPHTPSIEPQNLQVHAYSRAGRLAAVQVQWQFGKSLLTGSMNRISGKTEERLEVFAEDQKWQIDNLAQGSYCANQAEASSGELNFNDWESTLYKRGFVDMFAAFLHQLNEGTASDYEDTLATHALCERVVVEVERQLLIK
jgi:virulence factor